VSTGPSGGWRKAKIAAAAAFADHRRGRYAVRIEEHKRGKLT